ITDTAGGVQEMIRTGIDITENLRREIASLQGQLTSTTGVTAASYLQAPLSRDNSGRYTRIAEEFAGLLELRLEERAFKQDNKVSEQAKDFAGRLGRLHAGPRDIIELYKRSLEGKTTSEPIKKAKALLEEGRMLTLEIMGHLVSFYRSYYTGPSFEAAGIGGKEGPNE
ncbi:MAG: hypothetical protein ACLFRY_13330, partial [Spirochaetia bacterium]